MKRSIRLLGVFTVACLVLWTGIAMSTVVGSKHDMSVLTGGAGNYVSTNETETCIFCHTPHNAIVQDSSGNRLPLWNKSISRNEAGYTLYSSVTLNASLGQPAGISLLCMSCHDGVTAINSFINYGRFNPVNMSGGFDQIGDVFNPTFPNFPGSNIGGAADGVYNYGPYGGAGSVNINTKRLDDDHPVSFVFDAALVAADGGLQLPPTGDAIRLYNGKIECSSCHNPHEEGLVATGDFPFLRKSNVESAICTTCHLK